MTSSAPNAAPSPAPSALSPRVLGVTLAALGLARAAAGLAPSMWAWGLDAQRFLDPWLGWGLWAAAGLTLLPPLGRALGAGLERAGNAVAGSRGWCLAAAAAGALLVYRFPDRLMFLGDFLLRQGAVEAGRVERMFQQSLPLDVLLHGLLPGLLAPDPARVAGGYARGLGALEAGLLVLLALAWSREVGLRGAAGLACAACVWFGGWLTLYTGFAKSAGELVVLAVAIAVWGARVAREGRGELGLGLVTALAVGLHRSGWLLLPAWGVAWWIWLRRHRRQRAGLAAALAFALPVAMLVRVAPAVLAIVRDFDLGHHLLPAEVRDVGGMLPAAVAGLRPLDLLDLAFALCPLWPLGALWVAAGLRPLTRRPAFGVAAALVLGQLPVLLVHPQQGIFRDWDVFAPLGASFALLAGWVVGEALRAERAGALAAAVMAWTAVPAVQWLALHHDHDRGLARVRAFAVEAPARSAAEQARTWDYLGTRAYQLQRWEVAAAALARASQGMPTRRVLLLWGAAETRRGDPRRAATAYRRLLAQHPDDPLGWLGLGGAAARLGDEQQLAAARAWLEGYGRESPEAREIRRHLAFDPEAWPGNVLLPESLR